jgi:nitrite reductase/ring-hydroxylating ferredoxin subunit
MKESFPASWYPVCRSAELARGQVLAREAFGQRLALFRTTSGKVGAMRAQCVHMGADLAQGRVVGERLRCPLHEWEYGLSGRCEHIPGTADIPARARQWVLTCEEHYGLVFAFLGGEPTFDFPLFEASDQHLYSQAYVMDFDTPYQVLAANSFDSQHFSTVHHRELLAPPTMLRESPHHFGVEFNARVHGDQFHDRLLRGVGVDIVELSAHCWGGNTILAYNARTQARILFTLLPLSGSRTRVFILNVIASRTAPNLPGWARRVLLAGMHTLTVAFLKPDIAVMQQLQFKLGVLLPDLDHCFIEWVKYWKALPRVTELETDRVGNERLLPRESLQ